MGRGRGEGRKEKEWGRVIFLIERSEESMHDLDRWAMRHVSQNKGSARCVSNVLSIFVLFSRNLICFWLGRDHRTAPNRRRRRRGRASALSQITSSN